MTSTDLPSSSKPHKHTRVSLRTPLRCGFTIVLCSCLFAGAAQCRARAPQDVAEAARRYRNAKLAAQAPGPFHLPFDEPVFASPVIPVPEVAPPRPSFWPVHPNVAPAHRSGVVAPAIPGPAPLRRVDPFTPRLAPPAPLAAARTAPPARQ